MASAVPFLGAPDFGWLDDGRMIVRDELIYSDPAGRRWVVPAGFITDGASIPRVLWSIVGAPFDGPYRLPAVHHDAAYTTLGIAKDDADVMLYRACLEHGCAPALAQAIYEGVRRFGVDAYTRDQRRA